MDGQASVSYPAARYDCDHVMTNPSGELSRNVGTNTRLAIIELIITKIANITAFIILIRLLDYSEIAAIGIASGYLVFMAYLDVSPIRVLLRDYPKLSGNKNRMNEQLSALFLFWGMQTLMMLLVCYVIQITILKNLGLEGLLFLFFAMTVDFIGLTFHGWLKVVFYAEFKQSIATRLALLFASVRFLCYLSLIISPSLEYYAWILFITSLLIMSTWWLIFVRSFSFRWVVHGSTFRIMKDSLGDYGAWDHLNRSVIDTLFLIDTAILVWFVSTLNVSDYTVAMKFTSLLFLIPMQLHLALQLMLSHTEGRERQSEVIGAFVKLTFLVSILQFVFVMFLGDFAMLILFGDSISQNSVLYAQIQTLAIAIMSVSLPFLSVLNNFCNLRSGFFCVFLPNLIFGIALYVFASYRWGTLGIAWANVIAYSSISITLILYIRKDHPFSLNLLNFTPGEKAVFMDVIGMR